MHYLTKATITDEGLVYMTDSLCNHNYGVHKIVWSLFDYNPDKDRNFIYQYNRLKRRLFVVSKKEPQDTPYLDSEVLPYKLQFETGGVYKFIGTINSVIRREGISHDFVTDRKIKLREVNENLPPDSEIASVELQKWFERRQDVYGFDLDRVVPKKHHQRQFIKASQENPITISTMQVSGVLEVTDPEDFKDAAYNGIGPGKSWGCGLLLLQRIDQ